MTSAEPLPPAHELEHRLRGVLRDTSLEMPRPVVTMEMPAVVEKLWTAAVRATLRPAAVLVPVVRRGSELSVLLTVRAAHLRSHGGQIAFPGGARDAEDATAIDNALREAQEEVGIDPRGVEVLGYLDDYPTLSRFLVTPVVGLLGEAPALTPDVNEVAEVFEVPFAYIARRENFERKLLSRDGINVPFYELNWQQHRVWGATAGMLWELAGRMHHG